MLVPLEFERPVLELEAKIDELNQLTGNDDLNIAEEIAELRSKAEKLLVQTYSKLSPWQRVQVARHPGRPRLTHFVEELIEGSCRYRATGRFATMLLSSAASDDFGAAPFSCWGRRRARTSNPAGAIISAWRIPKATARRNA